MKDVDQAKLLRRLARSAIRQAGTFFDEADRLDPPARAVCDVCGEETRIRDDVGKQCRASSVKQIGPICKSVARCRGTYRPDETRARAAEAAASVLPLPVACTCDQCGRHHDKLHRVDTPCWKDGCPGTFRLTPEPVRLKDGPTLPVSVDDLAFQQAVRDFVHGDDEAFGELDIASTYRGA